MNSTEESHPGYSGEFRNEFIPHDKLPPSYKEFIRITGGGHPKKNFLKLPHNSEEPSFSINYFSSWNPHDPYSIHAEIANSTGEFGKNCLPIANDGGGNKLYLKLEGSICSVWAVFYDPGPYHIKVADHFEELIDMLEEDPDNEYE